MHGTNVKITVLIYSDL